MNFEDRKKISSRIRFDDTIKSQAFLNKRKAIDLDFKNWTGETKIANQIKSDARYYKKNIDPNYKEPFRIMNYVMWPSKSERGSWGLVFWLMLPVLVFQVIGIYTCMALFIFVLPFVAAYQIVNIIQNIYR